MPTDPLAHLSISDHTRMAHVVIVEGCVDVGMALKHFLTPVRLNLRCECPEKDLDAIIDTLSMNRDALKARIRSATAPPPSATAPVPVRTGPRKKFA